MLFWNIGFILAYKLISPLHPASHLWIKQLFSSDQNSTFSASLSFQVHATVCQDGVCVALGDLKGFWILFCFSYFRQLQTLNDPSVIGLCDWALCSYPGHKFILIIPLSSSSYLIAYFQICLGMLLCKTHTQYMLP